MADATMDRTVAGFSKRIEQIAAGVKAEDLSGADRITFDWNPGAYEAAIASLYFSVLRRIRAKKAFLATFGSEKTIEELSGEHEAQWRKSRNHNLKQLDEYYALRNGLKAALVSINCEYWNIQDE